MNREIKFRAWILDELKMYNVGKDRNYYINCEGGLFRIGKLSDTKQIVTIPETKSILMQYTGLKDKNGNEIYEGDILEMKSFYGVKTSCFIEWDSDLCGFVQNHIGSNYRQSHISKEYKIKGNIYENPEFLSSQQQR